MNEGSMCQSNPMHAREAGRPAPWRFGVGAHACMVMVRPSGRPVLLLLLLRPALPASRPVRFSRIILGHALV